MVLEPLQNPIGFGAADLLELGVAAGLVLLLLGRSRLEPLLRRFAARTAWCLILLCLLPIALRLLLLQQHPVPTPGVYDEFGHLLVADTLRHFRLANPTHPLRQFFETFFVLQEPSYSSIYPLGQGIMLALGRLIFGVPWAGVVGVTGLFCALVYWMLRAWTTPFWALIGGLLAVVEFGPLGQWMNDYWGGSLAALAGCLVFGALPRLMESGAARDAVWLGLGLGIHWLTRPFESTFLFLAVGMYGVLHKRLMTKWWVAAIVFAPALLLTLLHDKQVTGEWFTLPYQLSQQQYGVPASLTFQANPAPHRSLTPQQESGYKMQVSSHGPDRDSVSAYVRRFFYRAGFYKFFFLAPLWLAAVLFLLRIREPRLQWVLATIAVFALGENFYPYFQPHYLAALTGLFLLVSVLGLQVLSRWSPLAAAFLLVLCAAHFVFWYGARLMDDERPGAPQRRLAVDAQLAAIPGRQIVFVRYSPHHIFQDEWVYNEADIDAARIIWARDLGAQENEKLRQYYSGRTVWLLEPDDQPPTLSLYQVESPKPAVVINEPVQAQAAEPEKSTPKPKPLQPKLRFEDVK